MHVLYLHGFASSARSSKAAYFADRLAARGVTLITPDFNQPDFRTLTVSRMIGQVEQTLAGLDGPIVLIGSSLGAFVAVHAAAREPRVSRLVLLAPALDFSAERLARVGDRPVEEWRRTGTLNVFHYGYGRFEPLGFDIYTDVERLHALSPSVKVPTLVFQGRNDTVVDPAYVERWARAQPGLVKLVLLEDDHQLQGSLELMWAETEAFVWGRP
jgi:pimeloyl-ACP methyl ester carboxylesterase